MDNQNLDLKDHKGVLEDLDKLEGKLYLIINFYEELEILRQKRRHLVETFMKKDQIEQQQEELSLKKTVIFNEDDFTKGKKSTRVQYNEKTKSIAQVYDVLGNLKSYHEEVTTRISKLEDLKSENKSDSQHILEFDKILAQFRAEKDEIDDRIIQYVVKDVVEGKEELFNIISNLEEDNIELENTILLLDRKVDYLKDTIKALIVENQLLKKQEGTQSDIVRSSIAENVSLLLPKSLRKGSSYSDETLRDSRYYSSCSPELEDNPSVERSTADSFTLDAALASWCTDEASMQEHVRRIGRNFEGMEVNQMRLNMLKHYVQKHGAKYINKNTLIDPSKGMSLWHGY